MLPLQLKSTQNVQVVIFVKRGTSPSANAGSEGIVRFRRLQEEKGGAAGSSFQRLCQGTEATV